MVGFNPPESVRSTLEKRYFLPGETWEDLCKRVAKFAAQAEAEENRKTWEDKFSRLMKNGLSIPNSPALINSGTGRKGSVAACFTFTVEDTIESILEVRRLAAMTLKYGGGVGFELSSIRPRGSSIQSTHKSSCGPVAIVRDYNAVGDLITQGGVRKAALLGLLRVDHPDIVEFIHCKEKDRALANFNISVSIPDSFVKKLLKEGDKPHVCYFGGKQYYLLQDGTPILRTEREAKKVISVRDLWDTICTKASSNGDPGIIFIDAINRANPFINGPDDINHPLYFKGLNPCLTGDQKVYVADGRGFVPIIELVEEAADVPVFCLGDTGKIAIRMLRHPRRTGTANKIVRVNLSSGGTIRCTPNHKIQLANGSFKEAGLLSPGDKLAHGKTFEAPIEEIIHKSNSKSQDYRWISFKDRGPTLEHRYIAGSSLGHNLEPGEVVHHKIFSGCDNHPKNLVVMSREEHNFLHRDHMLGDKNPMRRFPEKNWLRGKDFSGERNNRYIDISNEEYFQRAVQASIKEGRLLTKREWQVSCQAEGLPFGSSYRLKSLGFRSNNKLLLSAAAKAGVLTEGSHQKAYRQYVELKKTYDLPLEFSPEQGILVVKRCEGCGEEFRPRWTVREQSFCSISCANKNKIYRKSQIERAEEKQATIRIKQICAFLDLQKTLDRIPSLLEWISLCKASSIPHRLRSTSLCNKNCFRTFDEVKKAAIEYINFEVLSVEDDGTENVYNGTVDEFHTLITLAASGETNSGRSCDNWVVSRQCGELPLPSNAACVLASVDLAKYVKDDTVNTEALYTAFRETTRLLDNLLEVSPWPDPIIQETMQKTRMIGVGVMGFTSMLDKLGIRYGSEESLKLIDVIGALREKACSEESILMGTERGIYPAAKEGETHRNSVRTVVAPTGSIAMMANTSWSIEPHLHWVFEEHRNDETRIRYLPIVKELLDEQLESLELEAAGDLKALNELIQEALPPHMVRAKDVSPEEQLAIMARWQKYTDSSISKTICGPAELLTPEKVSEIFQAAWELKIKGITVYADGSREGEPMSLGHKHKKSAIVKLPEELEAKRFKVEFTLGKEVVKSFVLVGLHPDDHKQPVEIFLKHPHMEDATAIQFMDLTTRLISLILRYRMCQHCGEESLPLGQLLKQLDEADGQNMFSVPKILRGVLGQFAPEGEVVGRCPECGGELVISGKCSTCNSCSWSRCG